MQVLRIWFIVTTVVVGGALVWSFAPILLVVALVAVGLGGVAVIAIAFARWIERRLQI